MGKYAPKLQNICESLLRLETEVSYDEVADLIEQTREQIFCFDYPIFDENYRKVLETKIIKNYLDREIGFETLGLFLLHLDNKLNNIMPLYNQLYKSELYTFNPFYDVDVTRTHNLKGEGTQNDNSQAISKFAQTPQNMLNGLLDDNYLTNATNGTSQNTSKVNNLEEYMENVVGKQGTQSYSSMLNEFRTTFLNIDKQIIDDLECLFMGLW